ncbi:MAG: hypothetical protein V2L15_05020 [Desulfobacteraceae bacterium]|jgi:hypothetical protein|nr:hypothetical protein [Desulfobacteraceae bacterium]
MTYNFDPDKWYYNELDVLKARLGAGVLTESAFRQAEAELDRRHQQMWDRLDGSYRLPDTLAKDKT